MKCTSCGGNLTATEPVCPFCSSREEVDLRAVNSRCLGKAAEQCPRCETALEQWQLEVAADQTHLDIDRCHQCSGIFFNPGELEKFLHHQVVSTVWLDWDRIETLRSEAAAAIEDKKYAFTRHYLPCPICKEIMNSENFGRRSGVLVDLCRSHGIWLDGGELRKISEWWHAGGKHMHQANETAKAERIRQEAMSSSVPSETTFGSRQPGTFSSSSFNWGVLEVLAAIVRTLLK